MATGGIRVRCNAKINLYLEVVGRREDGYHDIETVFQPVTLSDTVRVAPAPGGIALSGDDPDIPWDSSNLCWKAAEILLGPSPRDRGVSMDVTKGIPAGAGLGGGSADAAAVLTAVNEIYSLGLDRDALMAKGLEIGSDVPFFLFGRPAVGRGRGERLEETDGLQKGTILIVKPDISVSTRWAYENPNLILTRSEGGSKLNCLLGGLKDFPDVALDTSNGFQDLVVEEYPEIGQILVLLEREGARLSSLSGSGSACFAIFENDRGASRARDLMLGEGHSAWTVYPAERTQELLQWE
jgi:4-diphosphocytidyl-2-C-methyl-D-erythritol kinase